MIAFKAGVSILGVQPELVLGLVVAASVYRAAGHPCIVTSCTEGVHKAGSLHGLGLAADLRTRHVAADVLPELVDDLRASLDPLGFEVLHEDPDGPNAHIHIEYDPDHTNRPTTATGGPRA